MEVFGERLRKVRTYRHLTQRQLGNKIMHEGRNISRYETGACEPNLDTLTKIADALNVSVDYLLGRSDAR